MLNQTQLTLPGIPMPKPKPERPAINAFPFGNLTFGVEIECAGARTLEATTFAYVTLLNLETEICYEAILTLKGRDVNPDPEGPVDWQDDIEEVEPLHVNIEATLEHLDLHPALSPSVDVCTCWGYECVCEGPSAEDYEIWNTRISPAIDDVNVWIPVEDGELASPWQEHGEREYNTTETALSHLSILREMFLENGLDWNIVEDQSLSNYSTESFEVVSPILTGIKGIAEVQAVCDYLKTIGATVDEYCGVHVHIGGKELTLSQLKKVAVEWLKIETQLLSLPNYEGRTSKYSAKTEKPEAHIISKVDDEHTLIRHMCPNGRRYALNMRALGVHGTVEFRGFRSTLDAVEIEKDIRIACSIVQAAM